MTPNHRKNLIIVVLIGIAVVFFLLWKHNQSDKNQAEIDSLKKEIVIHQKNADKAISEANAKQPVIDSLENNIAQYELKEAKLTAKITLIQNKYNEKLREKPLTVSDMQRFFDERYGATNPIR